MTNISFNISDEMAKRLQEAGYLDNEQFFTAALQHELERREIEQLHQFTKEEMLAAIDELYGACEGSDFQEWYQEEKRRERQLEDEKYDRCVNNQKQGGER